MAIKNKAKNLILEALFYTIEIKNIMLNSNIQLNLNIEDYSLLLEALGEMPYKRVHHLVTKLHNQVNQNGPTPDGTVPSDHSSNFNIGDRIQARWKGGSAWYSGTIKDFRDGKYFIKYDDGDEEWTTSELITLLSQNANNRNDNDPTFKVGDRINGRWKGGAAWYTGIIEDFKDGKYFIKYDDGDEEWTSTEFITLLN
ncbi:MAG: hypothetical protein GY810_02960 [Aureispira sp.]|nr:hypothetical protein [Aureispira sp.]